MFPIFLPFVALLGLVSPIASEPAVRGRSIREVHELKRAACASDNVLRALQNAGAAASSFCSSYIGIPVKTAYTHVPGVKPVMYSLSMSSRSLDLAGTSSDRLLLLQIYPDRRGHRVRNA